MDIMLLGAVGLAWAYSFRAVRLADIRADEACCELAVERTRNTEALAVERARVDRMHAEVLAVVKRCEDVEVICTERNRLCDPHQTGTCQAAGDVAHEAWQTKLTAGALLPELRAR